MCKLLFTPLIGLTRLRCSCTSSATHLLQGLLLPLHFGTVPANTGCVWCPWSYCSTSMHCLLLLLLLLLQFLHPGDSVVFQVSGPSEAVVHIFRWDPVAVTAHSAYLCGRQRTRCLCLLSCEGCCCFTFTTSTIPLSLHIRPACIIARPACRGCCPRSTVIVHCLYCTAPTL
jgi:hypothetical protein